MTLVVGVPLLILGLILRSRGSFRGHLILTGTLAYFLYTYLTYAFGLAYNPLFLIYIAIASLTLFAFILAIRSIDVEALPGLFSHRLPLRMIAGFEIALATLFLLLWLGRILPPLFSGGPTFGLESYTTLVIQAIDLIAVVPGFALAGILIWRRRGWGYLLSGIVLIKAFTLFLAVVAMIIAETAAGVHVDAVETFAISLLAVFGLSLTVRYVFSVKRGSSDSRRSG